MIIYLFTNILTTYTIAIIGVFLCYCASQATKITSGITEVSLK